MTSSKNDLSSQRRPGTPLQQADASGIPWYSDHAV